MIKVFVLFFEQTLLSFGALGVFTASFIEEAIPTIPSTIVLLLAGFAFLHDIDFSVEYISTLLFIIAIPATLGMLLGSSIFYAIGYFGGKPTVLKLGRHFGISWETIEKAERRFHGNFTDELLIIIFRAVPIVPNTAINLFCGLIRLNVFKYIALSGTGLFLRSILLAAIGGEVGNFYHTYSKSFEEIKGYVVVFFVTIGLVFLYVFYRRKSNNHESQNA